MKKQATRRQIRRRRETIKGISAAIALVLFAVICFNVYVLLYQEQKAMERIELCYAHYEAQGWDAYEAAAECEEL